ncbi:protein FAM161B isoform X1 [Carcharodon carcharias]|uniref:protein FAM161B isoform X1 n=1 Tax=Carcharodon carcharias TaxID=13397 RepID=UPI001B7DA85F|nr:protein FAM161B isoform X1 [Carcharodon carcharias]XP_041071117.1 protein FAM161B isoform X1 [Carcharodon carcharias]XP_041071118.1 protein FAM161B isoform X1 [Carcharodon carcharias]XP_041071119.1 protein FAM161B isoform X1 [Carcharodon carcharias]
METLEQDQILFENQYHEELLTLKNSCRQRLLMLGKHYKQQKNMCNMQHKDNMKSLGLTEELDKFFMINEGRTPVMNSPCKLHSSGNTMVRNSYSAKELCSLTDSELNAKKDHLQLKKSSRPKSATSDWILQFTVPQPFNMTMREGQKKTQLLRSRLLLEIEKDLVEKQKEEETECQKKFRALPVPAHVYLQLYEEMNERNEERRKREREKRKEFLMSTQKPFNFTEKEEERKEKLKLQHSTAAPETAKTVKQIKKIPWSVQDPTVSKKLKEDELFRKIRIQMRAADLLKSASSPIDLHPYKKELARSSSTKTRQEKLGFLDEIPKFKPRINPEVPDYAKLYKAFQREARRKQQVKETTKCVPFELHTSKLAPRRSKTSEDIVSKDSHKKVNTRLTRSNSFGGIHSLSSDTLPTYTTDAARKRQSAVRKSLEKRDKQELEKAQWMEKYKVNTHDMSKTLLMRAKAMDPHQSLAETYKKTLQEYRQRDLKRKKEYKRELEEMKRRVRSRPYLFEQVTQKNAASEAERRFRERLRQAGVDEEFVQNKGRNAEDIPLSISNDEDNSFGSEYSRVKHENGETSESLESIKPVEVDEEKNIQYRDEGEKNREQEDDSCPDKQNSLDSYVR